MVKGVIILVCKPPINHEYYGAEVCIPVQGEEEACFGCAGGWCTCVSVCIYKSAL